MHDCKVEYCQGFKADFAQKAEDSCELIEEAVSVAKEADAVVLCIGEDSLESGEAFSKTNIDIPDAQVALVKAITSVNRNTAAVIFCGRPLVLTDIEPYVSAMGVMWQPETLTAKVNVKNVGERTGNALVQLYIADVFASVTRPVKELKGFERIYLASGESAEVEFEITEEMLKFHTASGKFEAENGLFKVFIGFDSETDNKTEFTLA